MINAMTLIFLVGIWCENDVVSMSMRRYHVTSTLIRHHFYVMCPLGSRSVYHIYDTFFFLILCFPYAVNSRYLKDENSSQTTDISK